MNKSKDNCTAMIVGKKLQLMVQLSLRVMKTVMAALMKSFLLYMKQKTMMKNMFQNIMA